jgi:putative flippase GtrA
LDRARRLREAIPGLLRAKVVRFVIVGGSASVLLMALTYGLLRLGAPAFPAGLCAYALSFVYAYLLQRNWTFGGAGRHARTLPRYFALQAVLALTSGGLSHLLVDALAWAPAAASAAMTLCVSAISYLGSSRWAFAEKAG